ncbi:HAD superfamily protein involved in N-acetyl-glucosamine catabolism [Candidatus Liberibacter solanacearum]|uniref:TIGR01459 family HAD-type hydrolase n=1 Tax=Candidatus Liberibacter solanacearum TaxID=556287 RepID=UPI0038711DCF
MTKEISSLCQISPFYDIILCDVWGVLHNGQKLFPGSIPALQKARENGLKIILLTNSPRPSANVISHIQSLGSSQKFWDDMITSGDLTHHLLAKESHNIFFIGPDRDCVLLETLNVKVVDEQYAETIICTGLYNDETEQPEDYRILLESFAHRHIPFICANPDILANRGNKVVPCAGALALIYQQLNGIIKMVGKPHLPIYEMAFKKISNLCNSLDKKRILAIGDGMETDIKGALQSGIDALYVSQGIHTHEYSANNKIEAQMLQNFFIRKNLHPHWWIRELI